MTHETCVGTCPCGGRVPESRGRPPSGCGPQSHRLGAGPLRRAPTQQAQECLHKVQLRQELQGASRAQCVHTCCACAVPGRGGGRGSTTHKHTHTHTGWAWAGFWHCPAWALGAGGSASLAWQALEGRERGQGLKGQCEETAFTRRGLSTQLPGVGEGPVRLLPVPGRSQSW